jgi:hypothetical protein
LSGGVLIFASGRDRGIWWNAAGSAFWTYWRFQPVTVNQDQYCPRLSFDDHSW